MDDNNRNAAWDDLLQDLGAEPDDSAYERHQPPAQELPPAGDSHDVASSGMDSVGSETENADPDMAESSAHADVAAGSASAPSDWNSLAESLGIEVEQVAPAGGSSEGGDAEGPVASTHEAVGQRPAAEASFAGPPGEMPEVRSEGKATEARESEVLPAQFDIASAEKRAGDEPSGFDDQNTDEEHTLADSGFADETDDNSSDDDQAFESDELPALPSQIDQALSDSAWQEDDVDDDAAVTGESGIGESGATDELSKAADDEADGGGISGEAARSAFDALFADGASGWGSAFLDRPKQVDEQGSLVNQPERDLFSSPEFSSDSSDDGLPVAGMPVPEETEKPKRKRSRRRRRGGKGRKSAGDVERGAPDGGKREETARSDNRGASGLEDSGLETSGASDQPRSEFSGEEGGASPAKTSRRHRSRRGQQPAEENDPRLRDDREVGDADKSAGDSRDEGELGGESARSAARGRKRQSNLPTWSDAIGMIVDGNLEQRAKSPNKPQSSRGRGGRGGGRRRGGKKPESK